MSRAIAKADWVWPTRFFTCPHCKGEVEAEVGMVLKAGKAPPHQPGPQCNDGPCRECRA